MCRSRNLWSALAVAGIAVAVVAPSLGAVVPVLLVAACPLMMLVMMGGMAGMARHRGTAMPEEDSEVARLRAEVAELRQRVTR